jgi:hypothetical protein
MAKFNRAVVRARTNEIGLLRNRRSGRVDQPANRSSRLLGPDDRGPGQGEDARDVISLEGVKNKTLGGLSLGPVNPPRWPSQLTDASSSGEPHKATMNPFAAMGDGAECSDESVVKAAPPLINLY